MSILFRIATLFLLLVLNISLFAQMGSVKVILSLNNDVSGNADKLFISGYLAKGNGQLSEDPSPRDLGIEPRKWEYFIDSVPIGKYCVIINGSYKRSIGHFYGLSYYLGSKKYDNIIVKNNSTETIKITYPNDCIYHKRLENKICPKCGKKNMVVPIAYGCIVLDPISLPETHYSLKESTGCNPTYYCKRDSLEF